MNEDNQPMETFKDLNCGHDQPMESSDESMEDVGTGFTADHLIEELEHLNLLSPGSPDEATFSLYNAMYGLEDQLQERETARIQYE